MNIRFVIHLSAFFLGALSLSWTLLGICVFFHYFISPALAAKVYGDFDEMDTDQAESVQRFVLITTLQNSAFSILLYLVGLGLGSLF